MKKDSLLPCPICKSTDIILNDYCDFGESWLSVTCCGCGFDAVGAEEDDWNAIERGNPDIEAIYKEWSIYKAP